MGGAEPSLYRGSVWYTPIIEEWYYQVEVLKLEVGDQNLNLDCREVKLHGLNRFSHCLILTPHCTISKWTVTLTWKLTHSTWLTCCVKVKTLKCKRSWVGVLQSSVIQFVCLWKNFLILYSFVCSRSSIGVRCSENKPYRTSLFLSFFQYNMDKAIVDSGTTLLRLPVNVFNALVEAIIRSSLVCCLRSTDNDETCCQSKDMQGRIAHTHCSRT